MACGPFETVGQGYAWSAAGLFVLALLMQLLIMVRDDIQLPSPIAAAPEPPLRCCVRSWARAAWTRRTLMPPAEEA